MENPMSKHATIPFLVLTLVLLESARLSAQASDDNGCSNATLKGDYAFTISGEILHSDGTIDYRTGIAMRNFDGNGNITFIDFVASLRPGFVPPGGINLNPAFRTGLTGTYRVNPDCTGTAEEDFPPPPGVNSGQVIKLMFLLSDHGRAIHEVVASLVPAGSQTPVPVLIHADGTKLGLGN
jgi:hypothetical protein